MTTMFPTAGRARLGYDREQVEEFFARARAAYEAGDSRVGDGETGAGGAGASAVGDGARAGASPAGRAAAGDEDAGAGDDARPTGGDDGRPTGGDDGRPAGGDARPAGDDRLDADDVRGAAFDLVRDGYATAAVDGALDRLEAAFVQRRRSAFVAARGEQAWMDRVADRATTLYPRLLRPAGQRFAPPPSGRGYERAAVDALLDRLIAYFDDGGALTSTELRTATFPSARASRAYHEGTVDAYLDRAVEVLLAVE
ncbi:DivIVA domain-containing protein [Georgenia sp. TF02-10]|uniref:DivIVA domain-containing protein n=1 Tax=Georgenia sp. TF02-10 TaxID=2917725 RepID=UPI001FA80E16|nr:DivIVA domain-containing protein [Georgenia sp. TF02-10]UNX55909.1 DivIVA domain-containing protein [Georgenia sp. TF02-10]